ncbi:MAG: hypothetical protein HPY52_07840 [Firmicutes bacterium]|nr:hypothetical protein [Bacillota bacterium]
MAITQKLMDAPAYKRARGAIRQTHHVEEPSSGKHPAWCNECAWRTHNVGGCAVFNDCRDPWLENGVCEAWADEEMRQEIEQAIADYEASH